MHYLALLAGPELAEPQTPESIDAEMAEYAAFEARNPKAIVTGEALQPPPAIVTVRAGSGGTALVTAGPYAESTEIVGGFYVLDADTLDDAIELARQIPAARHGEIELRPVVEFFASDPRPEGVDRYLALIRDVPGPENTPGTPEWQQSAAEHGEFGAAAGAAVLGGGALHTAETATTVRVRDDEVIVSDGPYAEFSEVVGGFYLLGAATTADAQAIAARIPNGPKGAIELFAVWDLP